MAEIKLNLHSFQLCFMHFSAILSVPCVLGEVEAESEDEDDDDDDCKKGSMDEVGILQVTAISSNPGYNGNRLFSLYVLRLSSSV